MIPFYFNTTSVGKFYATGYTLETIGNWVCQSPV